MFINDLIYISNKQKTKQSYKVKDQKLIKINADKKCFQEEKSTCEEESDEINEESDT